MRKGLLAWALALLSSAGPAFAQTPMPTTPTRAAPLVPVASPSALLYPSPDAAAAPTLADSSDQGGGSAGRVWVEAEYLLWWLKNGPVPPLVTTSPPAAGGILGQPGTTVLLGGSGLDAEAFSGGRFLVGAWLNDCRSIGLEADVFLLPWRSANFIAGNSGSPGAQVLARPFFNAFTGAEDAQLVAFPGQLAGTVSVSASSRLWGAGANGVCNLCCCDSCCSGYRVDLLGGFRYLQLDERLGITENLTELAGGAPAGTTFVLTDQFETRNQFFGGQFGARAEYHRGKTFVILTGLVALGDSHEALETRGSTAITLPGAAPVVQPGGLLALPTNSGRFRRDAFAVVPELRIEVAYQVTSHLRAFAGYTFLYWSEVLRPGDQIDRVVNPTQLPSNLGPGTLLGPARPAVVLKDSDFWAQGLNCGLTFRF